MKSASRAPQRPQRTQARRRGVALVASRSRLFLDILGTMVADAGFTPAFTATGEAPSQLLGRTRPALVVWDVSGTDAKIRPLMADAALRHLPMLLVWTPGEDDVYARHVVLPTRVAWITFPILRDVFRATIDRLVASALPFVRRIDVGNRGISLDAGVAVRCLDEIFGSAAATDSVTLASTSTTEYRSMRLLP
jgi:hypothetical protein